MDKDISKYLEDVRQSIDLIESHLMNIDSLNVYENDLKTIDAVERRLAIIGEAIFKMDKLDKDIAITDKRKIIGLRHILTHDYDLINDSSIWLICKNKLPILMEEILEILKYYELD
jgi:uncharacterized protein with HEPN domain